jgi:hypothetical protein
MLRPIPQPAAALLAALPLLTLGCASTPEGDIEVQPIEEYNPIGPATRDADSIGKYLGDLSTSIAAWNTMTLGAANDQERRKRSLLEINIRERVDKRHAEILTELETGPPRNRIIAAAALGFSSDPATLSPLVAALDDPEEQVVANALMGLGILASPDTPLGPVADILRGSPDPNARWSAADCALSVVTAGGDGAAVLDAARAGLTDPEEAMVRSQCAMILALAGDTDSVDALGELLFDETPLVSTAAARSLAYLGERHDEVNGEAARALFAAFSAGDRKLRERVRPALVKLSRRNFEDDLEEWKEWVDRLP